MTPPDESGTCQRVTEAPAAMLPREGINEVQTVPVPRDRVAEYRALRARTAQLFSELDRVRAGRLALAIEMTDGELAEARRD